MTIERAFQSGSTTLDQISYTQVNGMTLTPGAGNFLAVFSMDVEYSSSPGSEILKIAIYVNNVIQDHSEREIQQNSSITGMSCPVITSAYVTPGASQVVEVKYVASSASNPMFGTKRELTLLPALSTNYQDTDVVDDTIASATWATLDSMTRTPASGDYLLVFTTSTSTTAYEIVGFRLTVDGTPVAHTERHVMVEGSADPSSYCTMIAASISPNGSQVVEIEWARIGGSGTQTCHERNMIMIGVDSGDIFQATGTVDDTETSQDTDILIDDMQIDDPGADDYLVLFSSYQYYPDITTMAGTTYKIYEGGAEVTDLARYFQHEDSLDNTYLSVFTSGRITISGGTDDIQVYWRGLTSSYQRTIYTRTLVAIRESAGVTYKLEGITYDKDGGILISCDCYLYKDNQDNTITFVDHVVSDGVTGAYSFTGIGDNDAQYIVVGLKDDSPVVMDMTDNVRQPVLE